MLSNKTVVLGEASESDSEEISLGDDDVSNIELRDNDNAPLARARSPSDPMENQTTEIDQSLVAESSSNKGYSNRGMFSSSLFTSIGPASTRLARLVSYTPYNLLASAGEQTAPTVSKQESLATTKTHANELPLLHNTLYVKNQQLYACLAHIHRFPYEKASKDLHTISQRLVGIQKIVQNVESAVIKMRREQRNLDIEINMIA